MHSLSRRSIALLATAATLGAGSLTAASLALGAATTVDNGAMTAPDRGLVDGVLGGLLGGILANILPSSTAAQVQTLVGSLTSPDIASLLGHANPATGQLDALLAGLTRAQLTGAVDSLATAGELNGFLDTLSPGQIGDLLAPLTGTTLSSTLALLDTAQVTAALATLNPTELASVVDGLTSLQITQLLAALSTGNVTQLAAVIAALTGVQLTDGLGALSPVQLGDLLTPLSGTPLQSALAALTSGRVNDALATLTPVELKTLLGGMSPPEVSGVLGGANPTQLLALLGGLTPAQLSTALSTADPTQLLTLVTAMSPTQLSDALALLDPNGLTSVVGVLTPAEITSLIASPGGTPSVVTGLSGRATGLGTTPSPASVNALLAQVQALLGGGLPTVPETEGLLTTVKSLLGVSGLDTPLLWGLLATASGAVGTAVPGPVATALQGVIRTIAALLGAAPGTPGGTTQHPTASKPGGAAGQPATGGFYAYRASIGAIKVARNRRTATVTISCPSSAPKGCLVTLDGAVGGMKAFVGVKPFVLMRNLTTTKTINLRKAAATRLKRKGGALKVSALTSFSTLAAVTKTVKLARTR
jgi:hypothetical protein